MLSQHRLLSKLVHVVRLPRMSAEQYPQTGQGLSVLKLAETVDFARDCQDRDERARKVSEFVRLKVLFRDHSSFVFWCQIGDQKADRKSTRLNSSHRCISYA